MSEIETDFTFDDKYIFFSLFPKWKQLDWKWWFVGSGVFFVILHAYIVPTVAPTTGAQELADRVQEVVPRFSEAVEVTTFPEHARVSLALNHVVFLPAVFLSAFLLNVRFTLNQKATVAEFLWGMFLFSFIGIYAHLFPLVGNPDAASQPFAILNAANSSTLLEFAFGPALMSMALSYIVTMIFLAVFYYRRLSRLQRKLF